MSSRKMRRTTATTTKNNNRLKDLTNTNNKEKEQEDRTKRNAITPEIPDSRPSRMTASIVVEASSSPRCLGEKKEAQKQKKKKSTTFPAAGTRRKRVAKKKEDNQDEDFDDLMCEEEPLIGKRRRKGTGKASNTTRSRSDKPSLPPVSSKDDDEEGEDDDFDDAKKVKKKTVKKTENAGKRLSTQTTPTASRGATSTLAEYAYWAFSNDGGRRRTEERYTLDPYVKYGELFNPAMRQQVVNWMYKRSLRLSMAPETFHLAVRYCDTFLSKRECEVFLQRNGNGSEPVPAIAIESFYVVEPEYANPGKDRKVLFYAKEAEGTSAMDGVDFGGVTPIFPLGDETVNQLCNKLKRLGATCLFVAAKIVEVNPPCAATVASCTEVSTFNRSQLLLAERALLRELDFFLYRPNPRAFLDAYIDVAHRKVAKISVEDRVKKELKNYGENSLVYRNMKFALESHKRKVEEFCELTVDLAVLSQQHLRWQPSVIAASALAIALEDEWYLSWDSADMECMVELTGYAYDDLAECSRWLLSVLRSASVAEEIQRRGEAGSRWYSKLHANEKYRGVIDRVTDEKRPHMQRLESAFGYTNFTSKRGILLTDFKEIENCFEMAVSKGVPKSK